MDLEKPKKRNRGLKPKEKRRLAHEVRLLIGKDYSDHEILEKLEMQPHVLAEMKREILTLDSEVYKNLSSAMVFSDFIEKSRNNIRQIDNFFTKFKNRGQWSALVAGIKVKQEIHKDVIKLGQDLGFIDKKAGELKLSGEMSFGTMAEHDVMEKVKQEIEEINKIIKRRDIPVRAEVLAAAGDEVRKFMPSKQLALPAPGKVIDITPGKTKKQVLVKTKIKVQLKKRV